MNGEIISGDSVQVYKEMNIGSAKVTKEEIQGIKHHLLDIKNIEEDYSVYEFQKEVRNKIEEISSMGKLPILAGGTGLYLKGTLYDYEFSDEVDVDYNDYSDLTNQEAYDLLLSLDEKEASKLHPNNRVRVVRSLNIIKNNNMPKTELLSKQEHKLLYDAVFVGLTSSREKVYKRINDRVDLMVKDGLIEEAETIYNKYKGHNYSSLKAIGYKELFEYFKGNLTLEESLELIKKNTRNYAKRQYTWFNNQFDVKWFETNFDNFDNTVDEVVDYLKVNNYGE